MIVKSALKSAMDQRAKPVNVLIVRSPTVGNAWVHGLQHLLMSPAAPMKRVRRAGRANI